MLWRQRRQALGVCVVGCVLLAVACRRASIRSELLATADAESPRLVQRHGAVRGGSQLADLVDSPLMLAKQKIDQYLNEDSDDLVDQARKMNVVGSRRSGAPCTSLKCDNGVWQNDYLSTSEDRMEKVLNGEDPGKKPLSDAEQAQYIDAEKEFAGVSSDGMDADTMEEPSAPADLNALTSALAKKLAALKQHFREVRAQFQNGAGKTIRINVKPRGPRGPPGVPGDIGPQGPTGPIGSYGPPGHKGPTGPQGAPGVRGRKGKAGPTGSIGKPGGMGRKGGQGRTGPRGFTGAPGSRGLPGAAGAPGTNGKDGPPGPPGRNSPEGPPGKPGAKGEKGDPGKAGLPGANGLAGFKGQTGTTGVLGRQGPTGRGGVDGIGPPKPKPMKKAGAWPKGDCYSKADPCTNLGVQDNLCGKCQPLCKRCGAKDGFILKNSKGLRFKGYSFDDQNTKPGSIQVRNICMLARYGNEGSFKGKAAALISEKSYMESSSDVSQPHWFGNCEPGEYGKEGCCSNSKLVESGFNWFKYGTGNDCVGDLDKDSVTTKIVCIFDEKSTERDKLPPVPRDGDNKGGGLESVGALDETTYRSRNGVCNFILGNDGSMLIAKTDLKKMSKDWLKCADEDGACACDGEVRYGDPESNTWSDIKITSGSIECSNGIFGDPIYGVVKQCQCKGAPTETVWSKILPGKTASPYRLVMSKDGDLKVYSGAKKAVWSAETAGEGATQVRLSDQCCLTVMDAQKTCKWSSCGCPKPLRSSKPSKPGSPPPPPPPPPAPPKVSGPEVGTLMDGKGKSLINIRCADWRDEKQTWQKSKQIEYYSKCMAQDCVQSLESGDSTPGCRFLDSNNHCYINSAAQKWCAENPTYKDCNDGGPKWGTPPIGSASSPSATKWSPQQGVLLYGSAGDGKTKYGCQCMKDCTCYKDKCFCFSLDQRPVPVKKDNDQYILVLGKEAKIKRRLGTSTVEFYNAKWNKRKGWDDKGGTSKGKIIKNSGKKGECSCRCGEKGDTFTEA